jgi:putative holliday junction resolvase
MLLRPGVQGSGSRPVPRLGHRPVHRGAVPVRLGVRLAVDVGSVRVGVARSDPGGILASPLAVLSVGSGTKDELAKLAAAWGAIEVFVGLPLSLSGRDGAAAARARSFAAGLADRLAPIPVRLVDERFTTATAHDALRRGGKDARARRQVVDSAAAAVLLQAALDTERETGRPAGQLVASTRGDGA